MANYTGSNSLDDVMGAGTASAGTLGSDRWFGGAGNDTYVYELSSAGGADRYSGGVGRDTVEFRLTAAEWANLTTQNKLIAFKASVDFRVASYASAELIPGDGYTPLTFGITKNLTVLEAENVRVYADNVLVLGIAPNTRTGSVKEAGVDAAYGVVGGTPQATGSMPGTDADGNPIASAATWSVTGLPAVQYGAFTITPAGQWSFRLDNESAATQSLQVGQVVLQDFLVAATLGTSAAFNSVTITIAGTNDKATVLVEGSDFSVTERGGLGNATAGSEGDGASGLLTLTDVDGAPPPRPPEDQPFAATVTLAGTYGDLLVTRDATVGDQTTAIWSYTLRNFDNHVQALTDGQVVFDAFTLPAATFDGASETITIRVTGADDLAIISEGTPDLSVTEAGGTQNTTAGDANAGGTFTQTDPDSAGPLALAPLTLAPLDSAGNRVDDYSSVGRYGDFALNTTTGAWTYTLDNRRPATQALQQLYDLLGPVAAATETLTVRSSMSAAATQSVTVSIFGADDLVTSVTNAYSGDGPSVTESEPSDSTAGGTLTHVDTDGLFVQYPSSVTAGAFSAPAGVPYVVMGSESPHTTAGPNQQSFQGRYGDFLLDVLSGQWTYTVASNLNPDGGAVDYLDIESLASGQTATEVMPVSSNDNGASTAVAVTIIGRDDPAILQHILLDGAAVLLQPSSPVADVIEAGRIDNNQDPDPLASGRVLSNDIDAGESGWAVTSAADLVGRYGNFTFEFSTGDWTYRLRNDEAQVQQLTPASLVTDTLGLSSKDGTSHAITVLIRGANDTARISVNPGVAVDLTVKEAGGSADGLVFDQTAGGDLDVNDVDGAGALTEARFRAVPTLNNDNGLNDLTGSYGTFTFNANTGGWTYTLNNKATATQALNEGQIVTDSMVVYSKDVSASHVITVTIEGSYDQVDLFNAYTPDEAAAGYQVRAEGSWRAASGAATAVVPDYNAAGTLSGSPTGSYVVPAAAALAGVYGWFTVTAGGAWTYHLDNEDPDTLALVSAIDGAGNPVRSAQDFLTVSTTTDADHPAPETYTIGIDVFGAYTVVDYKGLAGDSNTPNSGGAASPSALPAVHGNGTISFTVRNGDAGETLGLYAGDPIPAPMPWGTVTVNDGAQTTVSMPVRPASSAPGVINQILFVWDGDQGWPANPALNLGVSIAQGTVDSDVITMLGNGGLAAGYAGNDTITGTDWADYMDGGDHGDLLQGGGGNDTLLGGSGNDELLGQANDDHLQGGAGNDTLNGGIGNDTLFPGAGRDRLTGGEGADIFVFGSGPFGSPEEDDRVTDYSVADDTLWFDQGLLLSTGYSEAAIAAGDWFNTASAAQVSMQAYESNDRFIYDSTNGLLYYDVDGGTGAGPVQPVLVALFTDHPALGAGEFVFGPAPGP